MENQKIDKKIKEKISSNPQISIIIPTYNRYDLLRRAINSVIKVDHCEIIIIDDLSDVKNKQMIEKYLMELNDKRITYHYSKDKLFLSEARNYGLSFAKSEWVFFLDDDDYLTDEFIDFLNTKIWENKEQELLRFPYFKEKKLGIVYKKNYMYSVQVSTLMVKRSVITNFKIKFAKGYLYEDNIFVAQLQSVIKSWKYINTPSIHYETNTNSSIMNKKREDITEFYKTFKLIETQKLIKNKIQWQTKLFCDAYYKTRKFTNVKDSGTSWKQLKEMKRKIGFNEFKKLPMYYKILYTSLLFDLKFKK